MIEGICKRGIIIMDHWNHSCTEEGKEDMTSVGI